MRVFFTNLGCKLNQAEVEEFGRQFRSAGHQVVSTPEEADLHVINTCTVTHLAARDSRKMVRRARRSNPRLRTVLTGCYAAEARDQLHRLAEVDLIVPNPLKEQLLERVHEAFSSSASAASGSPVPVPYVPLRFGPTRAAIKVEDGCNMRCAFCIIPMTRGRQRSRPVAEVVAQVGELVRQGVREVVVTGVQISSYRSPEGEGLYDLVTTLLTRTRVPRLRLTSIAPWQFDPRLVELWRNPRLCRHIHLSLQSGCDSTLRRMRRPYTAASYVALADRLRGAIPGLALTTDVIVGFPGESAAEFEASRDFVHEMGFARVHAFPFSSRPGTEAAELPGQVAAPLKKARMGELLEVARKGQRGFFNDHLGRTVEVLWEERKDGGWRGMSDNYIRVTAPLDGNLENSFSKVRLMEVGSGGMVGGI